MLRDGEGGRRTALSRNVGPLPYPPLWLPARAGGVRQTVDEPEAEAVETFYVHIQQLFNMTQLYRFSLEKLKKWKEKRGGQGSLEDDAIAKDPSDLKLFSSSFIPGLKFGLFQVDPKVSTDVIVTSSGRLKPTAARRRRPFFGFC